MSDAMNDLMESVRKEADTRAQSLQRLLGGTDVSKIFGQPITSGEYTVIPAARVSSGGGLGSGLGMGLPGKAGRARMGAAAAFDSEAAQSDDATNAGGGGGGGGGAMGRPIAAIVIGPLGVAVRPVIDMTKLLLAGFGAFALVAVLTARVLRRR